MRSGFRCCLSGVGGSTGAFLAARLALGDDLSLYLRRSRREDHDRKGMRSVLVVVPNTQIGEQLIDDLSFFLPPCPAGRANEIPRVSTFFGWEVLPFDMLSPAVEVSAERLSTLHCYLRGYPCVTVATVDALMQRIVPPKQLSAAVFELHVGAEINRDELLAVLDSVGYLRASVVEERGQLAVRGAVVDLFPPGGPVPVRLELFGDRLQSIRTFDTSTQRSLADHPAWSIVPVSEVLRSGALLAETGDAVAQVGKANLAPALLLRLRDRAAELNLPSRATADLEDALANGLAWPGWEHLLPLLSSESAFFWDYLPTDISVIVLNWREIVTAVEDFQALVDERAERVMQEGRLFPEPQIAYDSAELFLDRLRRFATHVFEETEPLSASTKNSLGEQVEGRSSLSGTEPIERVSISPQLALHAALVAHRHKENPLQPLVDEIRRRQAEGFSVAISVSQASRISRINDLLSSYQLSAFAFSGCFAEWVDNRRSSSGSSICEVAIVEGALSSGLLIESERLSLIADNDIFPQLTPRRHSLAAQNIRRFLGSVSQLKENDYVVHIDHGIALYRGLKQISVEGKIGDFLYLEYAEQAKLFVPVENIGKVQKYSAAEGKRPALSKLGGKSWSRTKGKVRENVAEIAGKLINLLAEREMSPGISFGELDADDREFADRFPFEETPDQQQAISDVLRDMSLEKPMDRLVCGDVGYGKTEVALRAAFKAVNRGKQVAVLVPTTVLADQHFITFRERFADYPVRVGCVSRFFSTAENKSTLAGVGEGSVDIIIGTHRLLQRDVNFADLGLVIIDEEHRFGVVHKEKLKSLRCQVDVMTLTATPIPRTLHLSLVGIRELSVIETPPVNRQVIRTYLAPFDRSIVREAVLRELGRSGQVFYVYNRVETIAAVADEVKELVPEARVEFAHGQMQERQLATVMHRFVNREIDVLVSTTIIESGLDIPNANTMIIRNADKFGLAELYQLRGRVGRGARRAYAYLLISDPRTLGPEARKRLAVLQSLDDLGVGFRLALQDMEIRGAGNLLGKDQSGHIELVGFELYTRILREAVEELRSRKAGVAADGVDRLNIDPEINIGFPAHIPPWYIPDVAERLLLYQRLVELRDDAHGLELTEEIEDRFGHMPQEVQVLLELMIFRSFLRTLYIISFTYRADHLTMRFHPQARLHVERLLEVVSKSEGRMKLSPAMSLTIGLDDLEVSSPAVLHQVMRRFAAEIGLFPNRAAT